jgi:hypothetical protein
MVAYAQPGTPGESFVSMTLDARRIAGDPNNGTQISKMSFQGEFPGIDAIRGFAWHEILRWNEILGEVTGKVK